MKSFVRIHIIFATFLVLAVLTDVVLIGWLHDLHETGPDEFFRWLPIILPICACLLIGVPLMWFLFAVYHLFVRIRKQGNDENRNASP